MGYSYKVYEIQTGAYITKFVHNEYLQMMLDIGIIPTIIFVVFLVKSLIAKNNTKINKIILASLTFHIFLDLDLQSIIMFYIMFMCFEDKIHREYKVDFNITFVAVISIVSFIYAYYGLACFMNFIGKNITANELVSNFTEAKVELMKNEHDINKIHKIADEILKNNKYEVQAYNANAAYYLFEGNFDKMIESKKKEIALDKYNIKVYEEYALMLNDVLQIYKGKSDINSITKYKNYILEIEEILENVKKSTDSLAYKITDNINLELSKEIKNDVQTIQQNIE